MVCVCVCVKGGAEGGETSPLLLTHKEHFGRPVSRGL